MHDAAALPFDDVPDPSTAVAYRRAARRLRAMLSGRPTQLHRQLRRLAVHVDSERELDSIAAPRTVASTSSDARGAGISARRVVSTVLEPVSRPANGEASQAKQATVPAEKDEISLAGLLRSPPEIVGRFADDVRAAFAQGVLTQTGRKALYRLAEEYGIAPFEASLVIALVQNRIQSNRPCDPVQAGRQGRTAQWVMVLIAVDAVVVAGACWWMLATPH